MKVSTIVASAIVACVAFSSSAYATDQDTYNWNSAVTNIADIQTGKIDGKGASVSASASGATSAVSISSIDYDSSNATISGTNQHTSNWESPVVNKATITTENVNGNGASIAASGSGAASVVAVSHNGGSSSASISNTQQYTYNGSSAVYNSGTLSVGNVSGNGTSVSVSATGAASVVSISSIK